MRFKELSLALTACLALGAFAANAAQANWFIYGTELGATATREVKVEKTEKFTLKGTILGRTIVIHATGLECSGTCLIRGSSFGTNNSSGKLKFTGVTVEKPGHCEVPGGTLTTNALEDEVVMRTAGTSNTFDRFIPAGGGKVFFELPLAGAECTLAGTLTPLEGSELGETEATGVKKEVQPVRFNAASNSVSTFTFGESPATLEGAAVNSLIGGGEFDATE